MAWNLRSMVGTLRSAIAGKVSLSLLDWTGYNEGSPAWSPRDYESMAREGYIESAIGYACIQAIAATCAGIPWKCFKMGADGMGQPYVTHKILDLLARPNKKMTAGQLTEAEIVYLLISGSSFTVKTGMPLDVTLPLEGPATGLIPVRPNLVRVVPGFLGEPEAFLFGRTDTAGRSYHPSRVSMLQLLNPNDPVYGLGPLQVAGKDVDITAALLSYIFRTLKRFGRPDGVVISKEALTEEQYARMKKTVDERLNNPGKPGGWKLFEGQVEIKEFQFKPGDMGLGPTELARVRSICSVFKVPPEIIGISEAKTYANYKEARKALYQEAVLPMMDMLRDKRNAELMKNEKGKPNYGPTDYLDYDKASIEALQEDKDAVWKRVTEAEVAGEITNNEWRAFVGMPKSTDPLADTRLVNFSRVPIDMLADTTHIQPIDATTDPAEGDTADEAAKKAEKKQARRMALRAAGMQLPMVRQLAGPDLWRQFEAARMPYIRAAATIFKKQLSEDVAACAKAIAASGAGDLSSAGRAVDAALQTRRDAAQKALSQVWMGVGMDFAERVDSGLDSKLNKKFSPAQLEQRTLAMRSGPSSWNLWIANYLAQVSGRKITDMQRTTRERIMGVAGESYAAGNGAEKVAKDISAAAPGATAGRALTIARTEIIGASNAGSRAAALSFGVQLKKAWLATDDGRTREDHALAGEGPSIGMDEPYEVGGSELMFPGDSSMGADASEVVACRCAETYETIEGGDATGVE